MIAVVFVGYRLFAASIRDYVISARACPPGYAAPSPPLS
jgi:hypothetical protein